jgi:hypothetical protein
LVTDVRVNPAEMYDNALSFRDTQRAVVVPLRFGLSDAIRPVPGFVLFGIGSRPFGSEAGGTLRHIMLRGRAAEVEAGKLQVARRIRNRP